MQAIDRAAWFFLSLDHAETDLGHFRCFSREFVQGPLEIEGVDQVAFASFPRGMD
jgi:hypothetical protein